MGEGEGKRNSRTRNAETFSPDDASSKPPSVYVIYYMLSSGGFTAACLQAIAKGVLDPRLPWADTCSVQVSTTRRPSHVLKTVKGLLLLVPPRTPRSSGYDVYAHAVYVVICYMSVICICLLNIVICCMSVICYMSVICLVLGSSCHMFMSVICCYMLYVCDMLYVCYMSSVRGGS